MMRDRDPVRDRVAAFVHAHRDELIGQLEDWVRLPSIAGDPDRNDALAWSAEYAAGLCRAAGFPRVEVWPQGESHAVFAEWRSDAEAPVVLVYSHHDVRATTRETWRQTDAFAPVVRDGVMYGRGTSDAKGQVLAHLHGLRAHLAATGSDAPPVTVRLLIDGEEELGSPHLEDLLHEHADDVHADLVVFSDTIQLGRERPAVCTSVRGMVGASLTVRGPARDVHSGAVSGPAPNPVHDLARVLSALHDDDGRIALPRFTEDVVTPDARQRGDYADLRIAPDEWLAASGSGRVTGERGYSIPELLWARPSIEVISVQAGDTEGLPRAVIPESASAELSIRIVDDQTPESVARQLEEWVASELVGVPYELEVDLDSAEPPYRTPADHPAIDAMAEAIAEASGVDPARVGRMGNAGGGPAHLLARATGGPLVFYGTGLVSDRWHSADERVQLDVLELGATTLALFWPRVARALEAPVADEEHHRGGTAGLAASTDD